MSTTYKNRNLSISQFLEQLQLEYICAELRKKIYLPGKDIDFWMKVMEGKKKKIEDLAQRNTLPTLFNDKDIKKQLYSKIYNKVGFPTLLYNFCKTEENKRELMANDKKFYYFPKSEVKVNPKDGPMFIGKINATNIDAEIVEVIGNKDEFGIFPMNLVTRII
jgi:hypothetical protein